MEFKTILKYSFIYVLLTTFLSKTVYLLCNYQEYNQIGFLQFIFNQFTFGAVFLLVLVLAYKEINRKYENSFTKILQASILLILTVYILKYSIDWVFYYLNNVIYTNSENKSEGLLTLVSSVNEIFGKPNISLIFDLFIITYDLIIFSLKNISIKGFLMAIFGSKIILATIAIFYYSLYLLFKKFNEKGLDAIIPIKNNLTLLKITDKPMWWILPLCIPFIRLIPKYLINLNMSEKLNKKASFAIGMTLLSWFFYGKAALDTNTITK